MTSARLRAFGAASSTLALLATGFATIAPASAEPTTFGENCPAPYDPTQLTIGQSVTGLTSTTGSSTPTQFSGTYVSTIEDESGDIFLFDLEGAPITYSDGKPKAGVWSSMSGSPVYAADGSLVGAVAYSFASVHGSTLAGVTPAQDMYELIGGHNPQPTSLPTPSDVRLSVAEQKKLQRQGFNVGRILPALEPTRYLTASGTRVKSSTLTKFAEGFGFAAPRVIPSSTGSQSQDFEIKPGSSIAAADSFGSLASYSVGTTTMVCGDQAVAFGHPFDLSDANRSIHGARTDAIVADGAFSYKMASLGRPSGVLTRDGLAGIVGKLGTEAAYSNVTTTTNGRTNRTSVPNAEALAMVVASQTYRDTIVQLQSQTGGDAKLSWTIEFTRKGGKTGRYSHTQRYSTRSELAEAVSVDIASDIDAILNNEFEDVTITNVTVKNAASTAYRELKVKSVDVRQSGKWTRYSNPGAMISVRGGKTLRVRVNLTPVNRFSKAKATSRTFAWRVPKSARGLSRIDVAGNASGGYSDWELLFEDDEDVCPPELCGDETEFKSLDDLILSLRAEPRQDRLDATFVGAHGRMSKRREVLPSIVRGNYSLKVLVRK